MNISYNEYSTIYNNYYLTPVRLDIANDTPFIINTFMKFKKHLITLFIILLKWNLKM